MFSLFVREIPIRPSVIGLIAPANVIVDFCPYLPVVSLYYSGNTELRQLFSRFISTLIRVIDRLSH